MTDSLVKVAKLRSIVPVTYVAFDIIEINGRNVSELTFKERRTHLESIGLTEIDNYKQNNVVIIKSGYEQITEQFIKSNDLEGIVMKNPNKPYDWIKIKNYDQEDFEVIGSELTDTGKKNGNTISAVHLKNTDGRFVGNCTFITDKPIESIVGRFMIVRYMKTDAYRNGEGKLRFPVFQKFVDEVANSQAMISQFT